MSVAKGQKEGVVTQQWTLVQRHKKITMKKTTFFKKSSTFNEVVNTPKEVNSVILIE